MSTIFLAVSIFHVRGISKKARKIEGSGVRDIEPVFEGLERRRVHKI